MPASTESPERHSGKLPTGLLWAGVGVAPLSALALLVGSGDRSLRAAIGLALLAVVLIGLSIVLRPAANAVKVELEDTIYDEIDVVREDVRNDIAAAARATHRAFAEKSQYLQETVEQLRGQLEGLRGELARTEALRAAGAPHGPAPHGPAPHPAQPRPGTVSASVPAGIVRHTETVQVTTRSTIVDSVGSANGAPGHNGTSGQNGAAGHSARPAGRRRAEEPTRGEREAAAPQEPAHRAPQPAGHSAYEESWTEQQLRKRLAETAQPEGREPRHGAQSVERESLLSREDTAPADRWGRRAEPPSAPEIEPADDRWPGVRAGDRWASLRSDDRGSELRMGERRSSMHADETGSEVRIEDRWAAIRRDEPRAGRPDAVSWQGGERWSEPQDRWHAQPSHDDGRAGWEVNGGGWERDWEARETRQPRALPATSDEPSASDWLNRWSPAEEPEPEPRRTRYTDDYR
jgi:hypothetical protein